MITALDFVFFFFSSRRRHTRSLCDWSSDVCSSDLVSHAHRAAADRRTRRGQAARRGGPLRPPILLLQLAAGAAAGEPGARQGPAPLPQPVADLGRMRAIAVLPPLRTRFLCADP